MKAGREGRASGLGSGLGRDVRSTLFALQPFHLFRFYFLVVSWKAVTNNPPGLFKYLPEFLSLLIISLSLMVPTHVCKPRYHGTTT